MIADYFFIAGLEDAYPFESPEADESGQADVDTLEVGTRQAPQNGDPSQMHQECVTSSRFQQSCQNSFSGIGNPQGSLGGATHGASAQIGSEIRTSTISASDSIDDRSYDHNRCQSQADSADSPHGSMSRRPVPILDLASHPLDSKRSTSLLKNHCLRQRKQSLTSQRSSLTLRPRSRHDLENYPHFVAHPELPTLPKDIHPLQEKFPPELLVRYPDTTENARCTFPAYLPMFIFPDDICIRASDERPRSTWHSFALTHSTGEPLYGVAFILWVPLSKRLASRIETRCKQWRSKHIDLEKRELSAALSAKLAAQKMCLSSLLAQLTMAADAMRARLNDEIVQCEERISMYTELLRPIKLGTSLKIDGLTETSGLWMPRALGLLGLDGAQQHVWRAWLNIICASYLDRELFRVPACMNRLAPFLPLERYLVNLFQEIPALPTEKLSIGITIRGCHLIADREGVNELPGSRYVDIYPLFRAISIECIITLLEAALIEARIIFISKCTSMLSSAALALVSLLYPLSWQGVYLPVLPRRLISYLEAPTPYIMGIHDDWAEVQLPEGDDIVVCRLDDNSVKHSLNSSLPDNLKRKLVYLLKASSSMHDRKRVPYGAPSYCTEAFPSNLVLPMARPASNTAYTEGLLSMSTEAFATASRTSDDKPSLHAFASVLNEARSPTRQTSEMRPPVSKSSRPTLKHSSTSFSSLITFTSSVRSSLSRSKRSSMQSSTESFRSHISFPSMASLDTLAHPASSIVPSTIHTRNNKNDSACLFLDGHELYRTQITPGATRLCDFSLEQVDGSVFCCSCCGLTLSEQHARHSVLPCSASFDAVKVRLSFVRCMADLLQHYRKNLEPVIVNRKIRYKYTHRPETGFLGVVMETSAWHQFIDEACTKSDEASVLLFSQILMLRNKGKLGKRSDAWLFTEQNNSKRKVFNVVAPNAAGVEAVRNPRIPDVLDPLLFSEPRRAVPTRSA